MKNAFLSILKAIVQTLLHLAELALVAGSAWAVLKFFNVSPDQNVYAVGIVMAALAKFARACDLIPFPDWVNSPGQKPSDTQVKSPESSN